MEFAADADGGPFVVQESLWRDVQILLDSPADPSETLFQDIDFDLPLTYLEDPLVGSKTREHNLELPELYDFNYASFPRLEEIHDISLDNSVTSSVVDRNDDSVAHEQEKGPEEDVWHFADILGPLTNDVKYLTWEAFSDPTYIEECPFFLSEAGPSIFDAALQFYADDGHEEHKAGRAVQSNTFLRSLWHLSCGRASVLFPFDPEKKTFYQALDDGRLSGYTLTSNQNLIAEFLQTGNAIVELRGFAKSAYTSRGSFPGLVSLANAVSMVLDSIDHYLVSREKDIQSLLQLQALFERPKQLLSALTDVVNASKSAKTNEEILSVAFSKAQDYNTSQVSSELMMSLVSKVSQPWLSIVEQQVGLRQTYETISAAEHNREPLAEGDSLTTEKDTELSEEAMPLLSKADQTLVTASSTCLTFMKQHHPEHPLCKNNLTSEARNLELAFDWTDLERIETKARRYHDKIQLAVNKYNCGGANTLDKSKAIGAPDEILWDKPSWPSIDDSHDINTSAASLDSLPPISSLCPANGVFSTVAKILEAGLEHEMKLPCSALPISLVTHLSLQPLLIAQHNLLTTAALRCTVLSHSIRKHLDLCHAFHLCSSGFFTSRLSSVLFDPSFESVERERNTLRSGGDSMGLKLGSGQRRDWPPASSELRLALRGVLTESWHVSSFDRVKDTTPLSQHTAKSRAFEVGGAKNSDLPGGLSFTLRTDLKPEEIDRVLDPDSVYALDFLALTYTPGRALESIFTTPCLDMYSRIFRLMLRILRMNFIVGQIFRDIRRKLRNTRNRRHALIHRFRQESTYFITTLTSHFVHTGIGRPWTRFQTYLNNLELFIRHGARSADNANTEYTMDSLTTMHEITLRTITTSLFLRTRQRKLFGILENICDTILRFARLVGDGEEDFGTADGEGGKGEDELQKLYAHFGAQRTEFVAACRVLGEKVEFGSRKRGAEAGVEEEGALAVRELVEFL